MYSPGTMYSKLNTAADLESIRLAPCPNTESPCQLIFTEHCDSVHCSVCLREVSKEAIIGIKMPASANEAFEWLQARAMTRENAGKYGDHWRAVSLSVDGVAGYDHVRKLFEWFEYYGVTPNREVKKLSEMGRTEPINIVTLGNYAFGIRKQYVDLFGYGIDRNATAYLSKTIAAIRNFNMDAGDSTVFTPLSQQFKTWTWDTAAAVSRACTGREIFARILRSRMLQHMKVYGDKYKRVSKCNDDQWADQMNGSNGTQRSVIDIAMLANLLQRSIVLLDSQPSETVVFVPFLVPPDWCYNRNGEKRPPIVLAWADRLRNYKVPMVVCMDGTEFKRVWLPKDWLQSVWGFKETEEAEKLISQYLPIDDRNRCLVAHGIYFKPGALKGYVSAFDTASLQQVGVHPFVQSICPAENGQAVTSDKALQLAIDDRLWICMRCYGVNIIEAGVETDYCVRCKKKNVLRKLQADGTVQYRSDDHTTTPAPASWCYTKRKHIYNGREYDNPPMILRIRFSSGGHDFNEVVQWFSDESNKELNSVAYEIAASLMEKRYNLSLPFENLMALTAEMEKQILSAVSKIPIIDHRLDHLKECLGQAAFDDLFDNVAPW